MAQGQFGRRQYPPQEPSPQPDPILDHDGTVSAPWKWAITAAVAMAFLLAMYGVTTHRDEQHAAGPPAATEPSPQVPAGPTGETAPVRRPGG
jgi:hypothetical protein